MRTALALTAVGLGVIAGGATGWLLPHAHHAPQAPAAAATSLISLLPTTGAFGSAGIHDTVRLTTRRVGPDLVALCDAKTLDQIIPLPTQRAVWTGASGGLLLTEQLADAPTSALADTYASLASTTLANCGTSGTPHSLLLGTDTVVTWMPTYDAPMGDSLHGPKDGGTAVVRAGTRIGVLDSNYPVTTTQLVSLARAAAKALTAG